MTKYIIAFLLALVLLPFELLAQEPREDGWQHNVMTIQELLDMYPTHKVSPSAVVPFNSSDLYNPYDWKNQFDNIIVINKSNSGERRQTLWFFKSGGRLVMTARVSTGRERWEAGKTSPEQRKPERGYFSSTNVGYFSPYRTVRLHKSKLWDADMPYSVFFDGGIATHQVPPEAIRQIGSRASGGCVRLLERDAAYIYDQVNNSGIGSIPRFTTAGRPILDSKGQQLRKRGYRTLIIVQDFR